jgi:hypothetical protein
MPAQQAEFEENNEKHVTDDPDETKLRENKCANSVDKERYKI